MNSMTDSLTQNLHWYALHTHPKQEARADENLRSWNVETFTPKLRSRRPNPNGRTPISFTRPLFPRYIFARFRADEYLHKVKFTRGVASVVGIGNVPTPIDDQIIEIIKSQSDADSIVKIGDEFEVGNKVVICQGPLKGLTGIFERNMKDSDRVMILLNTISYQSHIVVERQVLRKAGTQRLGV
jgi:transcriptional antiterminator RfaH